MNACITRVKAQILENCQEEGTRKAAVEGDRDGDGVPDDQDNCPNVPNPQQAETDPNVTFNGECRFIDNGDGTVADFRSRLVWLKDAGGAGEMTWDEANDYCEGLSIAGGRWRLPTENHFQTLFPLPSGHPFMNVQGEAYWTEDMDWTERSFMPIELRVVCEVSGGCWVSDDLYYDVWPVLRYMR